MNITVCGCYRGRLYRINAVINSNNRIVMLAAEYFPQRKREKRVFFAEPERPVSMNTHPFNSGGRRLARQLQAFMERSYIEESSQVIH